MSEECSVTFIHRGNVSIARIEGQWISTIDETDELLASIKDGIQTQRPAYLVIDMQNIQRIATVGINMLLSLRQSQKSQGGDMYLASLSSAVNDVLELTQLTEVFNVAADVDAAMTAAIREENDD